MSKWRDIRVIDDERVADLMRDVPQARAGTPLSLDAGIAVARRAGAGKLVMGDLMKVGSRTRVVAKIFDVRTGQRMRNVIEETANPDSLMAVFGRLARGILAAQPPEGADLGTVGTASLEAYRAYAAGVRALNRMDLDSAAAHLERAVALDSNFALAHYKLSVTYGWINPNERRRVTHAERANRLAAGLPPRVRALIRGQYQNSQGRWGEACQTYGDLLAADSADVEAWYNLGECHYHDQFVVAGDSATPPRFRGSWNTAMTAFERTLELDPTYHLAFAHIPDILLGEQRAGCAGRDALDQNCPPAGQYLTPVLRRGDTLVTEPIPATDAAAYARAADEAVRLGVFAANLERTRVFAQAWVNAGPDEPRAHLALARALVRSGRIADAQREFALARGATDGGRALMDHIELLFKADSLAALAALIDSLANRPDARPGDLATFLPMLLGRWQHVGLLFGSVQAPPPIRDFLIAAVKAQQGAPPADLVALERGVDSVMAVQAATDAQRRAARTQFLMTSAPWTLDLPRTAPATDADTTSADPRLRLVAFALRDDTARTRTALLLVDSLLRRQPRELPNATGWQTSAEVHLHVFHDTTTALARLLEFEARLPFLNPAANYLVSFGNLTTTVQTWGRTFLRLADLAAARGNSAVAVRNYRRVIALWETADPAFRPQVEHARASLSRLAN
jgi:tetratricopeptide (TPR) repeat protein